MVRAAQRSSEVRAKYPEENFEPANSESATLLGTPKFIYGNHNFLMANGESEDDRKFKIRNMSSAAFEIILCFIYTRTLGNKEINNDMWLELLKGTQKLELDLLRKMCANRP